MSYRSSSVHLYCMIYLNILQVLLHLSHSRDDIVLYVLAFLSLMLHFGNENVQKGLGEFISQHDTLLFNRIHAILDNASTILLGGR